MSERAGDAGILGTAAGLAVLGLFAAGAVALNGDGETRGVERPPVRAVVAAGATPAAPVALAKRVVPPDSSDSPAGRVIPTAARAVPRAAPAKGGGGACGSGAVRAKAAPAGGAGCGCAGGGGGGGCGGGDCGGGCGGGGCGGAVAKPAGAAPVVAAARRPGGDRNPRHGGIVAMRGNEYVEIARTAVHEWRVYLSDAARKAVAARGGSCKLVFLGASGELGSVDLVVSIDRQFFAGRMSPPAGARKVRLQIKHPSMAPLQLDMPFPLVVDRAVADGLS